MSTQITRENIKEQIREWDFATCPTEEKEPFFWKWSDHGLDMLSGYIELLLTSERERVESRLGHMRQWLNEDRVTDHKKMVTTEELAYWIYQDKK